MCITISGDKSFHGIKTIPSDNIKNIINHDYEREFIERRAKRDEDQITRLLLREENLRGMETKASIVRDKAIKEKIERQNKSNRNNFRLRQFDNVKASEYISNTTKEFK